MNIGYACLTVGLPNTNLKTCRLNNATENNLHCLIEHNLNSLNNIIDYNISQDIKVFRICSELVPFGSHTINKIKWQDVFSGKLNEIAQKINKNNIRVSMHPGQYTILNSPNQNVIYNAIKDLEYHFNVLDSLHTDTSSKIVLHIGGVYGDKIAALKEFSKNFKNLDSAIKNRIVIENDDKFYNIEDTLNLGNSLNIPVIFDILHHKINPASSDKDQNYYLQKCSKTFLEKDGRQKIHFSQQHISQKAGSHSKTINCKNFIDFYNSLDNKDIDLMLEVKDKNLSAIKCINAIDESKNLAVLEMEWQKYKYKILECSPSIYQQIKNFLNDSNDYPVIAFYHLIDKALNMAIDKNNAINTALRIFDYLKNRLSDEKSAFLYNRLNQYKKGKISIKPIKAFLWENILYFNLQFLSNSYYFHL